MQLKRYGIELERLQTHHLELIRQWRNSDAVRTKMYYQEKIGRQQQMSWFRHLDPLSNWYFVASANREPFGLLNIKDINWEKLSGESGAFVGNALHIGDMETGLAILALMDFAFLILGLDLLTATYHPGFKKIASLNGQLGYRITGEVDNGFVKASLPIERYLQQTGALRTLGEEMNGNTTVICDEGEWLAQRTASLRAGGRPHQLGYVSIPPSF